MSKKTWLVTGGAGFIGVNFVRYLLKETQDTVVVLDKLTYAGNLSSLKDVASDPRFHFLQADIAQAKEVAACLNQFKPETVVNLAAESHVDRSIDGPLQFVQTNVMGTAVLLEQSRSYFRGLDKAHQSRFRFLQVSTDEVYGSLGESGLFLEESPYQPNSPYAASKAAADHLVQSYFKTYDLPVLITNCSNNYGPFQFPEKLIPLMLLNAIEGKKLPIYGDGKNIRDWIFVQDHCAGIFCVSQKGKPGEKYLLGSRNEKTNLQIVDTLCDILEKIKPAKNNNHMKKQGISSYKELKKLVEDRPGHDRRYAIDASKVTKELGWKPQHDLHAGLEATVQWYLDNADWCQNVQSGNYQRDRLGLSA